MNGLPSNVADVSKGSVLLWLFKMLLVSWSDNKFMKEIEFEKKSKLYCHHFLW